jgi:hypothetical protein
MEKPFEQETIDFLNAYYDDTGISAAEMKTILSMEDATDDELMSQFTEDELQLGIDEYDELYELINDLLYYKSIDNYMQYLQKLEILKEFNNESFSKNILNSYLDFEKRLFNQE